MTHQRTFPTASAALALLALCATTAIAQTPPNNWPWGSGFERRQTPAPVVQPEALPVAATNATTTPVGSANGKAQGTGQDNSAAGRGNSGGTGSGNGGRGR